MKQQSWLEIPAATHFSMANLPFGIFQTPEKGPRVGIAVGEYVLDLAVMAEHGLFTDLRLPRDVLTSTSLNPLLAVGRKVVSSLRQRVQELLRQDRTELKLLVGQHSSLLERRAQCQLLMPVAVGDYTDFYSSESHAYNVGSMFRGPDNALPANWRHLPIGYHGRSSSIIGHNQPIYRPHGLVACPGEPAPRFQPSRKLDFELELGFITYGGNPQGKSIPIADALDAVFGCVLLNDWSARDIQAFEYVPLGPFLGKNFATSISPWVVTMDALNAVRTEGPVQQPNVADYLREERDCHFDLDLSVQLQVSGGQPEVVSRSNAKHCYWSIRQMLAHHTVGGCPLRAGDILATGTISAPDKVGFGSMLELSWNGTKPLQLAQGQERSFLEDGDHVGLSGVGYAEDQGIGFGELWTEVRSGLD